MNIKDSISVERLQGGLKALETPTDVSVGGQQWSICATLQFIWCTQHITLN